jgi:hypothetical protein
MTEDFGLSAFEALTETIRTSYRSLSHPDFSFVKEAQRNRPYESIIRSLRNLCVIEDSAPEEEDVCFSYMIQRHDLLWKLDLSMVAPVGLFVRLKANVSASDFIVKGRGDLTDFERKIVDTVVGRGVKLLPADILKEPVPLTLFNTPRDKVSLYQALFTDKPIPWI